MDELDKPTIKKRSQTQLKSCDTCGRTFARTRLPIHQKECTGTDKGKLNGAPGIKNETTNTGDSRPKGGPVIRKRNFVHWTPKAAICYICDKQFEARLIHIHEARCEAKWRYECSQLPMWIRRPPLPKKPQANSRSEKYGHGFIKESKSERTISQRMPCKSCGHFAIHEPRCLQKRKDQNAILTKRLHRPLPNLPQTMKGTVRNDIEGINKPAWQSISSRVPCIKCGRYAMHDLQCLEKKKV